MSRKRHARVRKAAPEPPGFSGQPAGERASLCQPAKGSDRPEVTTFLAWLATSNVGAGDNGQIS